MPVVYEIDQRRNTIRTRCTGYVTLDEVLDHFHDLAEDPDCPESLDVLLDLAASESVPSSAQLRLVSEEIHRIRNRVQFGSCAIVVGTDALYGAAMILEVLAARGFRVTKIFRDQEDAEFWLAAQKQLDVEN